MTEEELRKRFPNASADFIRLQLPVPGQALYPTSSPIMERDSGDGALAAGATEKTDSGKFLVRVTSYRRRLLDEDNLAEKFHVDCCRYAGLLPDDAPDRCRIETTQQKVRSKEEERTLIEISQISKIPK